MAQKVTLRDIAEVCGVSVATVSYVLNRKSGQKISEPTRKKVLQIAHLLGYKKSEVLTSMESVKTGAIALLYTPDPNPMRKAADLAFFESLSSALREIGKNLVVLPGSGDRSLTFCEAAIGYNLSGDAFRALADSNMIPMVAVGIDIDDFLWFRIHPSLERAKEVAAQRFGKRDYDTLYLNSANSEVESRIQSAFPGAIGIGDPEELEIFLDTASRDRPVLCFGEELYDVVKGRGLECALFETFPKEAIDTIVLIVAKLTSDTKVTSREISI